MNDLPEHCIKIIIQSLSNNSRVLEIISTISLAKKLLRHLMNVHQYLFYI